MSTSPTVAFGQEAFRAVLGELDANLRLIEKTFGVRLAARDGIVTVKGEPVPTSACARFLDQLAELSTSGFRLSSQDVQLACRLVRESPDVPLSEQFREARVRGPGRRLVAPRTAQQRNYLEAIRTHEIVFAIGPAGTGKTYLAVAMAIEAFVSRQVRRLILCRPAVEAGERLGFLPGDLAQKVDPYLRPLYDALYDIWEDERARRMIEQGVVEVAPLAFMRGRTLNESFIILDEAQNTTPEQMKMFLTRVGEGSRVIVTGDITQVDLPRGQISGLVHARNIVQGIEGIAFIHFDKADVVRHELVQRIVEAYEHAETPRPPSEERS
ncbi:MAG: PhoH family protein [Acidobacteriota bacterium]